MSNVIQIKPDQLVKLELTGQMLEIVMFGLGELPLKLSGPVKEEITGQLLKFKEQSEGGQ